MSNFDNSSPYDYPNYPAEDLPHRPAAPLPPLGMPDPDFLTAPAPAPPPRKPSLAQQTFGVVREVVETVVPAIVIALLINLFLAQATRVYGQSMEPTLHTDQRLVVEKVSYAFSLPHRGDVVVLKVNEAAREMLIKRVIGLPGETVEVHDGQVYINGQALEESEYLSQTTRGRFGPLTVPENHIFVMGDNRGASNDSRSFGPVSMENVVGKAWVSYWPPEDLGLVH